jgi:hypothetical protein
MIIVKKSGYLKYRNLKFRCALGKAGVKKKVMEGDNITPKGIFKIIKIYYARILFLKKMHLARKSEQLLIVYSFYHAIVSGNSVVLVTPLRNQFKGLILCKK